MAQEVKATDDSISSFTVTIAEINIESHRTNYKEIGGVRSLSHERGCEENDWTDTITLIVGGGEGDVGDEQTMTGRGYGLDVVSIEPEGHDCTE